MPSGNSKDSQIEERVAMHARLTYEADSGRLENIQCPSCRKLSVSVWFTNPSGGVYRTWFLCNTCYFHSRVQNKGTPHFYSTGRCRADLGEYDALILEQSVFETSLD
jgi:hypothetical protein